MEQKKQIRSALLSDQEPGSEWHSLISGLVTMQQVTDLSSRAAGEVASEQVRVRAARRHR